MLKLLKNKKTVRSVVRGWAIYYFIVMLIPIIISVFSYTKSQNVLSEQVTDVNFKLLQQITDRQEKNLINVQRISFAIELNEIIEKYSYAPIDDKLSQQNYLRSIRSELDSIKYMTEDALDVFLYMPDTELYLTASGIYYPDVFHSNYLDKEAPYEIWKNEFMQSNIPLFFKTKYAFGGNALKNAVGFKTAVPALSLGERQFILCIMCDMSEFSDAVKRTAFMTEGGVVILNKYGHELFSQGIDNIEDVLAESQNSYNEEISVRNIEGKETVVCTVSSEATGWKYIYFIPQKAFLEKLNVTFYTNLFSIVLIFLIGGTVIFFLLRRNYSPVQRLLSLFKLDGNLKHNEFEIITEKIIKTIEEKETISTMLDKQNKLIQKNYLVKLMTEQIKHKTNIADVLLNLGIPFLQNEIYTVIMFNIDSWDEFFADAPETSDYDRSELVEFVFENIFTELICDEGYKEYVFSYAGNIFCIVAGESIDLSVIKKVISYAQTFFEEKFKILFSAAVSESALGYDAISKGYRQVSEIAEMRFLFAEQELLMYSDIETEKNDDVFKSLGVNKQNIRDFIEKGNRDGAVGYITSVLHSKANCYKASTTVFRFYMFELTQILIELIEEIYFFTDCARELQNKLLSALNSNLSSKEYIELFASVIEQMCNDSGCENQNNDVVVRITKYIDMNYDDISLNIETLANKLGLSSRYISSVFKKEKGIGILDYIGKVRIDKVKTLLVETHMTIDNIFQKVGFTNKITFIRVFKKLEGMTPTQYRTLKRK